MSDNEDWDEFIEDDQIDKKLAKASVRDNEKIKKKKQKKKEKDEYGRSSENHLNPLKLHYTPNKAPIREAVLNNGHAVIALELLASGYFDYQIAAQFGVSHRTLLNWKNSHEDLKMAWELGEAACHSFWTLRLQQMALEGNEAGYKAVMAILNNRFRYHWGMGTNTGGASSNSPHNVQNITIQNMNVMKNLPTKDLVSNLNAQIEKFKDLKVLDADFQEVKSDDEQRKDGE